jgi:hypothetical protein
MMSQCLGHLPPASEVAGGLILDFRIGKPCLFWSSRELAKLSGYTSCFVVAVAVAVAVACLFVLYSIKEFMKLPLQSMQFGILPLQKGSSVHSCMQFGILPQHYSHCSHAAELPVVFSAI